MSFLSAAGSAAASTESPAAKFSRKVYAARDSVIKFDDLEIGDTYCFFGFDKDGEPDRLMGIVAGRNSEEVELDDYRILTDEGDIIESEDEMPYKTLDRKYFAYPSDVTELDEDPALQTPSFRKSLIGHLFPLKQEDRSKKTFDELIPTYLYEIRFKDSAGYYTGRYVGRVVDNNDAAFFARDSMTHYADDSRPELQNEEEHVNGDGFIVERGTADFYYPIPATTIAQKILNAQGASPFSPVTAALASFFNFSKRSRRRNRRSSSVSKRASRLRRTRRNKHRRH
jgi:hypothetical protein